MSYIVPPFIASLHIVATTGAAANNTLVAAPGAGFYLRVMAIWMTTERGNTAGAVIELHVQDGAGGTDLFASAMCASAGKGADHMVFPAPGIRIGANDLLNVNSTATVATQGCDVGVAYYVDALS